MSGDDFGRQLKQQFQIMLLKIIGLASSRKFWAALLVVGGLWKEFLEKAITSTEFTAGVLAALIAYIAGVVIEDVAQVKAGLR